MRQFGFTLIELLLVLAIIGIISAIAIPALLGQREAARNRATVANAVHVRESTIVAFGDLDKPPAQRATDLMGAMTIGDVLAAISARSDFDISKPEGARNPFNKTLAAYRFDSPAPLVPGEVSLSAPTPNPVTGELGVLIGYGIMIKGNPDLTQRIGSIDATR
jgi:prepilin-type N-terminal cleavage/methylation domain-containing protein